MLATSGLLAGLVALGLVERRARDRARTAVPIRVHVNGTRGKSTTTRLIAGALREAGIRTLGKTTGAAPRLILPDGCEQPIRRRAPASIREQLWVLREAARRRASALVVECMAIDPDLQAVSERDMIAATIGVITNVRLDHGDVMGTTLDQVGAALSATVPHDALLVLGPTQGAGPIERAAATRGARLVHARPDAATEAAAGSASGIDAAASDIDAWMADNICVALAVTRALGIDDEVARRGMQRAAPDPGMVERGTLAGTDPEVAYVDATAANDPESLARVLGDRPMAARFVFHHRADRPYRLQQFAQAPPWRRPDDAVVVTGDRPDWATWRRVRASVAPARLAYCPADGLAALLRPTTAAPDRALPLVFCGNTKGFERQRLLAAMAAMARG
jgi:poly-gamma-glutamate synthase PgsB/CapB